MHDQEYLPTYKKPDASIFLHSQSQIEITHETNLNE